MSTPSTATAAVRVRPAEGCGTLESPWIGWENQLESASLDQARDFAFAAGFWGVEHPVRLATGTTLGADPEQDGRPWFVPVDKIDSLFRVDGAHEISLNSLCLNGGGDRATSGLFVRCATSLSISGCRFGDFAGDESCAIRISGESADRLVTGIVIQGCLFVNGTTGIALERHVSDLLITDNRFEEFAGPSLRVDPRDEWASYGLIFVKNRIQATSNERIGPMVEIGAGAEGLRLADNDFRGPDEAREGDSPTWPGLSIRGGGPRGRGRIEVMTNRMVGLTGPAVEARQCGPGFLVAGNSATSCGSRECACLELVACHGALVEDNELHEFPGPGIRLRDCSSSRVNGNEIRGLAEPNLPRGGSTGILIEGDAGRRLRVTDNRVSGTRDPGIMVTNGVGIRIVGNEIQDCGEGIRVAAARNLLVVGNDCRDNGGGGIRVGEAVNRAVVALNYAILNGPVDLEVLGRRITCEQNKVDRTVPAPGNGSPRAA